MISRLSAMELTDKVQVSGFMSQAVIHTSDNNFFGDTDDDVGFDYRELGLIFSAAPYDNLYFSAQLLSRKAGHNSNGDIEIDHALVNYNFINDYETTIGVRAGRLKSTYGWYNETRDVPFTRPGIFLAQSMYVDRVRNSYFFQDGIHLRGESRFDLDTISWHVGYHRPSVDDDEFVDVSPIPGLDKTEARDSYSASLIYDHDAGRMRIGLFLEKKDFEEIMDESIYFPRIGLAGQQALALTITNLFQSFALKNERAVLSFEYNTEQWSFVAEANKVFVDADITMNGNADDVNIRGDIIADIFPDGASLSQLGPDFSSLVNSDLDQKIDSLAYYLQASYRPADNWDILLRYDVFYFDDDKKDGEELANDFKFNFVLYPAHAYYAKDWTLGTGWHISRDWLLRFEWHYIEGTGWITSADNPDRDNSPRFWNMFATQISYRF